MRITTIALFSLLPFAALACGSSLPAPADEWAAAQADVGRAQAGGAPAVPDARLHLQLAQEDLQKSKDLMDKDNKRAGSLVALARTEAQLALSMAKAAQAQEDAQKAQADVQKVKGQ
jgi:hypothetical protein